MATIIFPLFIALLGALIYAFAGNSKAQELGRLVFFAGVFWLVHQLSGRTFRL